MGREREGGEGGVNFKNRKGGEKEEQDEGLIKVLRLG